MKKKFRLWLNIATICLCICVIAVGVYSAQQATLNISGNVGFKAHNCDVYVYGTVSGAVDSSGASLTVTPYGTESTYKNVHEDKTGWSIGAMYFNDLGDVPAGKKAFDIVITLKMYNDSAFGVLAKFNTNFLTDSRITITADKGEIELSQKQTISSASTMIIALSLNADEDFDEPISFNEKDLVTFERYETVTLTFTHQVTTSNPNGYVLFKNGSATLDNAVTELTVKTGSTWYELIEQYNLIYDLSFGGFSSYYHRPTSIDIKNLSKDVSCKCGAGGDKIWSLTENNPIFNEDTTINMVAYILDPSSGVHVC